MSRVLPVLTVFSNLHSILAVSDPYSSAVVGSFVADAASMGLHWIYDTDQLKSIIQYSPQKDPAFFEPPSCPFYKYPSGRLSPYGAESFGMLRLLSNDQCRSPDQLAVEFAAYLNSLDGYKNKATKLLIANLAEGKKYPECGADDGQANALAKVPVLVARFAGSPDFLDKVEEVIRVHQNNDLAVRCARSAALILNHILEGSSIADTITWIEDEASPLDTQSLHEIVFAGAAVPAFVDPDQASARHGASCALPGALLMSLHVLRVCPNYEEAVRFNIRAGGDQCSRGAFIGACFAAAQPDSVPAAWKAKVLGIEEIETLTARLRRK